MKDESNDQPYALVGDLNPDVYEKFVSLETQKVIMTKKQQLHDDEKHDMVYTNYHVYLSETFSQPDIIFWDKKYPASVVLLKRLLELENETYLKVVLKFKTLSDPPAYFNSIITMYLVRAKEFRRLIRQACRDGRMLYQKIELDDQ